jgi:proteasome lid subunit RPN8/RPN11
MEDILITYGASRTIIRQARLCAVETGGILAGTASPLTILAAGEPGPNATHQVAMFTSDPDADTACLKQSREQHGEIVMLLGWWHKHPVGLTTPSPADWYQARQLAKEFNDGQPVLIGIVNRSPRGLGYKTTLYLYATSDISSSLEHPWKLSGIHSRELKSALKQAAARPDVRETDYWQDKDFQFYLNPVGRTRIRKDLAACRDMGWNISTSRGSKDRILTVHLSDGRSTIKMILPPEYPLNPPTVLSDDGLYLHSSVLLTQWNSLNRLVDLAVETFACMRSSDYTIDATNPTTLRGAPEGQE